jgi:NADH-quinone oxidoreductase subunit J
VTGVEILFALLGVVAVGSALLVAASPNLVHCALWLVVTLGALAGCYLLLAAEFVAWVQVLIYMGAVVVLLLFALMLTRAPTGAVPDLTSGNRFLAGIVATATAGLLIACFAVAFEDARITVEDQDIGDPSSIGGTLFGSWVLAFELLSVILLAALIGAIVLSRRGEPPGATAGGGEPVPDQAGSAGVGDAPGGDG